MFEGRHKLKRWDKRQHDETNSMFRFFVIVENVGVWTVSVDVYHYVFTKETADTGKMAHSNAAF